MDKDGIQRLLENNPEYREKLFCRGFLFTDDAVSEEAYPFYGLWRKEQIGRYALIVSPQLQYSIASDALATILLLGHAYDPFSSISNESEILTKLLSQRNGIGDADSCFWREVNALTGVFTIIMVRGDSVVVIGDASGMQTTFYCVHGGKTYISSHTNLIGDLLNLEWDSYVKDLTSYCFFPLLGNSLPGDLTQFTEVKRLIPNHYIQIVSDNAKVVRFFWPQKLLKTPTEIVNEVSRLMQANMRLIARKWKKPAISMTGGCDSKTTLACTKGAYDKFSYFSYISSESEAVDAVAAKQICDVLGLPHTIYEIADNDNEFKHVSIVKEILNWNTGNIRYSHPNDIRKRIFFSDTEDFDVEVKSWASEIGRAYYSKRFNGRTQFGDNPTPRKCTTLYKFFFNNRRLVRQTDRVFEEYLARYFERAKENPVEWQEQFFWEFRMPSWNGLVITGEHRYSFDITIPYNNRRILELLLSVPIAERISDQVYKNIRAKMNPEIDQTGIAVTNLKHTENRGKAENIYYILHTHVPF